MASILAISILFAEPKLIYKSQDRFYCVKSEEIFDNFLVKVLMQYLPQIKKNDYLKINHLASYIIKST